MAKLQTLKFDTYGNEKQKQAFRILLNNQNGITDLGYGGGAGGGKSYTGVAWQWMLRNKYPGTRGFFGRKELKRLKQTTLASYFKFCDDYNIPIQQRGIYNAQDSVIKFANKSEILLLDLSYMPSDPLYTRFGSLELTDGFADEIAEIESQCLMILKTRIGRHRNEEFGLLPKFLGTFNPDKGHVYRDYYKPFKEGNLPDYREFIPALATDNKKLPAIYIEQLKKADNITQQRLLYGNFDYDDTPGRLFDYNALLDLFNNPSYNGTKYISCDAARKGKDIAVIMVWDGFEIIDIVSIDKCTNTELENKIKELAHKHQIGMHQVIVDENGVGGGIVDHLECIGFINNASPLNPWGAKNSSFLKRNFEHLKTQCYFELATLVNTNKIKVNAQGDIKDKLIEELDIIVQIDLDKDGKTKLIKKEDIKEKIGRSPDYSDCMMFRMWFELLKDPETEGEYKHINPKENPYGENILDEWERMNKENEGGFEIEFEGGLGDDKLDGDVL